MLSFFYFLQLLNNWPKLLVISWNSMTFSTTSPVSIKVAFIGEDKSTEVWNSVDDIMMSGRNVIVELSICDNIDDKSEGLKYFWQIFKEDVLDRTTHTSNCSIEFLIDPKSAYKAKVSASFKKSVTLMAEAEIPKKDVFWMAAIGDSFSSGQGNPDIPSQNGNPAEWMDEKCYRSSKAFPYLTSQSLPQTTAISFLSCSGATVDNGILSKNGQFDVLSRLIKLKGRSPDTLMLTVGGNDIGFTDIMSMFQDGKSLDTSIDIRFFYVSHQLDRIAARISDLKIKKVVLVLYYKISENEHGFADSSCGLFGKVSSAKLQTAEQNILQKLNNILARKARQYGWDTVDVGDIFQKRGLCSKRSLIRTRNESMIIQGNEYGSFHPNEESHQLISRRVLEHMKRNKIVGS